MSSTFLQELAYFEWCQPDSTIMGITSVDTEAVALRLANGQVVEVPKKLSRVQTYHRVKNVYGAVLPAVLDSERGPEPIDPSPHWVWCELLEDLGAYQHHLGNFLGGDVHYHRIDLSPNRRWATVTLSDDRVSAVHHWDLTSGRIPYAVAVDWAAEFPA